MKGADPSIKNQYTPSKTSTDDHFDSGKLVQSKLGQHTQKPIRMVILMMLDDSIDRHCNWSALKELSLAFEKACEATRDYQRDRESVQ